MQKYNWNYPTTMWVGENRINDIAEACKNLGIAKPLLVTDKGLSETDIVKNTLSILDKNKLSAKLYSNVVGNASNKYYYFFVLSISASVFGQNYSTGQIIWEKFHEICNF